MVSIHQVNAEQTMNTDAQVSRRFLMLSTASATMINEPTMGMTTL